MTFRVSIDEPVFYATRAETREKTQIIASISLNCVHFAQECRRRLGYRRYEKDARRPATQLDSSWSGLPIELYVMVFIGRSPTQELLCHKSNGKIKSKSEIFFLSRGNLQTIRTQWRATNRSRT